MPSVSYSPGFHPRHNYVPERPGLPRSRTLRDSPIADTPAGLLAVAAPEDLIEQMVHLALKGRTGVSANAPPMGWTSPTLPARAACPSGHGWHAE